MKGVYIITKDSAGNSLRGETVSIDRITSIVKEILESGYYAQIHKI